MAAFEPMNLYMIRIGSHLQRVPFVAGLPTAFPAARFSQAAITRLPETIAGRRFAAVATVLGQLVFQGLDTCFQLPENAYPVFHEPENQFDDRIFALSSDGANFLFRG